MESALINQITSSPSLPWVFVAIGFHIVNSFLGAFMGFFKKTPPILRIHTVMYLTVVLCLIFYLVLNWVHGENRVWDYLIFLYFITILPFSKRWDVVIHAFFTLIGLTLLPVLVLLQVL